jgi:microcystin-dependent protein
MPYLAGNGISDSLWSWRFVMPADYWFIQVLIGCLNQLTFADAWTPSPGVSSADASIAFQAMIDSIMPFPSPIGSIVPYATNTLPVGVLLCDGMPYLQTEYPELYSAIGTFFSHSGDASDTFRVPDLRGRLIIGAGQGSELSNRVFGDAHGREAVALTTNELPAHAHADSGHTHSESVAAPTLTTFGPEPPDPVAVPAIGVTGLGYANIQPAGNGNSFDIMQPNLVLTFGIICGVHHA